MPEETEEVEEVVVKPKRSGAIGKMLLIVLLAVASSAGGGVVSFMLIKRTLNTEAKGEVPAGEQKEIPKEEKIAAMLNKSAVLALEPFVVNLSDTEAARYLRIKVSLMIDDKSKLKEIEENQALQLKVRDVILQTLTSKSSHDLINEEGKNKLRHEIQEKLTIYFEEPKLVDIMFTEFVIQL